MAIFRFIESCYSGRGRRRHSSLGYKSLVAYEQNHRKALAVSYS